LITLRLPLFIPLFPESGLGVVSSGNGVEGVDELQGVVEVQDVVEDQVVVEVQGVEVVEDDVVEGFSSQYQIGQLKCRRCSIAHLKYKR
jgi:hypothetical protein